MAGNDVLLPRLPLSGDNSGMSDLYRWVAQLERRTGVGMRPWTGTLPANQQGWVVATLAGTWVAGAGASGSSAAPSFYSDPAGIVHLRGTAANPAAGSGLSTIFTLPAGYRPNRRVVVPAVSQVAAAPAPVVNVLYVEIDGSVRFQATNNTNANFTDVFLDGTHFRVI